MFLISASLAEVDSIPILLLLADFAPFPTNTSLWISIFMLLVRHLEFDAGCANGSTAIGAACPNLDLSTLIYGQKVDENIWLALKLRSDSNGQRSFGGEGNMLHM